MLPYRGKEQEIDGFFQHAIQNCLSEQKLWQAYLDIVAVPEYPFRVWEHAQLKCHSGRSNVFSASSVPLSCNFVSWHNERGLSGRLCWPETIVSVTTMRLCMFLVSSVTVLCKSQPMVVCKMKTRLNPRAIPPKIHTRKYLSDKA